MCSLSEGGQGFSQATHQSTNQTPCIQSQISKRKRTQCQPEPLWNFTSSFPHLKYKPQCHDLFLLNSIRFQLWIFLSNHDTNISANISLLKKPIRITTIQMTLDILGWRKGYEEASKIGVTGVAAKVAKDPDRYCKLQIHFPEKNTFIGKWFYLVSGPLFDEFKKQHNALKQPIRIPTSQMALNILGRCIVWDGERDMNKQKKLA
ncbi:hypothetical protein VP01_11g8 [Puccinia sorghi]|uniref:Tet-like 2OG-Fe(II) oxygenase domain-containing protein n=1 Tax=Puccinia sorghi TaxID=27349 RepID=A0A0L6VS21_9BASI|nr:hypothetical protein VP01_11g8 [Puccinia sorghi]